MVKNLNQLLEKAKTTKTKTIAIAAAEDENVMKAIEKAKLEGFIRPIFIGNSRKIKSIVKELNITISNNEIIDIPDNNLACLRAVQLVSEGNADLLMKGLVSTGTLLKHVVSKKHGLLSGKLLSHLAIFESPNYHKLFGVTDAAMNIAPASDDKIAIIHNAVKAFHSIGINKPKVALLAAVEKVNPKITSTTDAETIVSVWKNRLNNSCIVDGPFALDNAISKEAAQHKGIHSTVAGDADILIAPDLNSGNILYKSLSFLGNAKCAAIIVGCKAPIVLTSRADSEETKFLSIVLGVITSKN